MWICSPSQEILGCWRSLNSNQVPRKGKRSKRQTWLLSLKNNKEGNHAHFTEISSLEGSSPRFKQSAEHPPRWAACMKPKPPAPRSQAQRQAGWPRGTGHAWAGQKLQQTAPAASPTVLVSQTSPVHCHHRHRALEISLMGDGDNQRVPSGLVSLLQERVTASHCTREGLEGISGRIYHGKGGWEEVAQGGGGVTIPGGI